MARDMRGVGESQDRDAFARLFAHFAPRLKGFLMRGGASGMQAEELTQEAMLTLWRRAASFDPDKASVSTWLFTIARNRRIDAIRRDRLANDNLDNVAHADGFAASAEVPLPDDDVAAAERQRKLRAAMDKLPPEQAALLRLAFFNGWSHDEISRAEDIPLGTVKSRIRLAIRKLRADLDGAL